MSQWDASLISAWARCLGTDQARDWGATAAELLAAHAISGHRLPDLIVQQDGTARPSSALLHLCGASLDERQCGQLAVAIGSLLKKGYYSTVGAVKVEGTLQLEEGSGRGASGSTDAATDAPERRECSLVDFAGQMEYLVSHQLLLASMHTLCMVIQPVASFCDPTHRHHGSWAYWLRFLAALGDRRNGSLLLAVSQLDRVPSASTAVVAESAAQREFESLSAELGESASLGAGPVRLDYRPSAAQATMVAVREVRALEVPPALSRSQAGGSRPPLVPCRVPDPYRAKSC